VFQIPITDRPRWIALLHEQRIPDVLRRIAETYSIGRGDLGIVLADLSLDAMTPHVQAVWTWDLDQRGRGLTDEELVAELVGLRFPAA